MTDLHSDRGASAERAEAAAIAPTVVCLCGSTRWPQAFELANMHESLMGRICISVGMHGHADQPTGARFLTSDGDESTPEKQGLDQLHFRKIDLADEILVINPGGYVGSSTRREIAYAKASGKRVRWLFPDAIPELRCSQDAFCTRLDAHEGQHAADLAMATAPARSSDTPPSQESEAPA